MSTETKAICNLEALLKEKGRTLNNVNERTGTSYQNLLAQKNNRRESIDYKTIAKLCVELDCEPGDLIVLDPPRKRKQK